MANLTAEVIDLFAGPGGWSLACAVLGLDELGIEYEPNACNTRRNAGFRTLEADVASLNPADFVAAGLIASPPCPAFSAAGAGHGRAALDDLVAAVGRRDWSFRPHPDPAVWLVLEVGRWYESLQPEWIALEQVPTVLPLWEAYARLLDADGYSTWTGVLNAADYGVAQTRERAILVASRTRPAHPPPATHTSDPSAAATLFGELLPWVPMATALGLANFDLGFPRIDDTGTSDDGYRERDWRPSTVPAFTLSGKSRSWVLRNAEAAPPPPSGSWILSPGRTASQPNRRLYDAAHELAPTLAFGHDSVNWIWHRPATTLCGDSRVFPPGGHTANDGRDNTRMVGRTENTIRLTPEQALALQSFPPDFPVAGAKTRKFQQIGNAVPPLVALAVLSALTGKAAG